MTVRDLQEIADKILKDLDYPSWIEQKNAIVVAHQDGVNNAILRFTFPTYLDAKSVMQAAPPFDEQLMALFNEARNAWEAKYGKL